jgi:hypothetical protein
MSHLNLKQNYNLTFQFGINEDGAEILRVGARPPDIKVRSASMSVAESIEVFYVKNPSTEPAKFELPPL